jgi:biotin carboxylase
MSKGFSAVKRLAFVYHPRSFATLDVHAAAAGVCELVWVVDRDRGETTSMIRLLQRLGPVVDVTGLDHDAAAAAIAAARPDGILALHDALLSSTAEVAQRLGLPFHLPATARALSDKRAQRAALAAAGIPMPAVWPVPPARDRVALQALLRAARFPAVLKPRVSEASRNTVLVAARADLQEALRDVARHTPADRDALLLEEYLADRPGAAVEGDRFADHVSVETAVVAGRARHLALTGRFPPATPFRETGMFLPAALAPDDQRAVLDLATAAAAALGIERGCLHTEIKLTPDGPRVIEVNGRVGGGVPAMLRAAAGVELLPIALRLALGTQEDLAPLPATTGVAYALYRHVSPEVRRITAVDGLAALRARPDVDHVVLYRGPGAEVDWRIGTESSVFEATGRVADHDALLALRRAVEHGVHVAGETDEEPRRPTSFRALSALNALTVLSTMPLVA